MNFCGGDDGEGGNGGDGIDGGDDDHDHDDDNDYDYDDGDDADGVVGNSDCCMEMMALVSLTMTTMMMTLFLQNLPSLE